MSFIGVQVRSAVTCSTGVWKGRKHSKVVHAMVPDYTSGSAALVESYIPKMAKLDMHVGLRSKATRVVHFYGQEVSQAFFVCVLPTARDDEMIEYPG